MRDNTTIILQILSAGVIAALVTGIFSLIVAVKNNKRLIGLEKCKQQFTVAQERFKGLREAYNELLSLLPEEKLLGHIIMNFPSKENFQETGLSEAYKIAEANMKIIYSHYKKYCYLLSNDDRKKVDDMVKTIDSITKSIITINAELQVNNNSDSYSAIHKKIMERIINVTKFEEMYYNLFENSLSKLSNSDIER